MRKLGAVAASAVLAVAVLVGGTPAQAFDPLNPLKPSPPSDYCNYSAWQTYYQRLISIALSEGDIYQARIYTQQWNSYVAGYDAACKKVSKPPAVEPPVEQPVDPPVEQPVDTTPDLPVDKPVDRPTERPIPPPVTRYPDCSRITQPKPSAIQISDSQVDASWEPVESAVDYSVQVARLSDNQWSDYEYVAQNIKDTNIVLSIAPGEALAISVEAVCNSPASFYLAQVVVQHSPVTYRKPLINRKWKCSSTGVETDLATCTIKTAYPRSRSREWAKTKSLEKAQASLFASRVWPESPLEATWDVVKRGKRIRLVVTVSATIKMEPQPYSPGQYYPPR